MKILCLHGYGTSGEIFEQQMSSLIANLGSHHEYIFLDGEVPVARSQLAGFYSGDTLAYYDGFQTDTQAPAHEHLAAAIAAEDPPFDGVLGFSQGGGFAISYLIQHMIDHPDEPLPFKFGVFFTPAASIAPVEGYKHKEIMSFLDQFGEEEHEDLKSTMLARRSPKNIEDYEAVKKLSPPVRELMFELMHEVKAVYDTREVFHITERETPLDMVRGHDNYGKHDFPRFFNAAYTPQRLPIPTVHVVGSRDESGPRALAKIAQKLCAPDKVIAVETPSAHEIPYKHPEVDNVVRAIEKAIYMSQMAPAIV